MRPEMIEKGIKAEVKLDCFGLLCAMPITWRIMRIMLKMENQTENAQHGK
jgi:hypothetical protein